jgi:hypothetical protein
LQHLGSCVSYHATVYERPPAPEPRRGIPPCISSPIAPRHRKPTIAFAGGGHAHLYSLRRAAELTGRGFDVVLVNPSPYLYYSGMATGVVSGLYDPEETRTDVRRLVVSGGGGGSSRAG